MVIGVSYAGKPLDNTAMYITKKVEHLVRNLKHSTGCMVFINDDVFVPTEIEENNQFIRCDNPQAAYTEFVNNLSVEIVARNRNRKYTLTEDLYYIGENVKLGTNCVIEPGCFIDHDVIIGNNALIKANCSIKHAKIGDNFIACEGCTIGTSGFTMADDDAGNKFRIPTLGKVIIGNNVEIGANTDISCGSAGNTVIEDNVKVDALVHIGHDDYIAANVELTCGAILGGFNNIGEKVFLGLNCATRNRIDIGDNVIIGMGAVVTKSVSEHITVAGNPAKQLVRK